ncbi:MAG TPA: GNAT family N-acetyltransferase [Acidimicrobiales bacterium]|nr:GNAT family N-acetyltransferase [Acidimicrobiales bacterium]
MEVRRIDPHDDAAFSAWFSVLSTTDRERWPGLPGWQRVERLAMALDEVGPEEHQCLSAFSDGHVVGIADIEMYRRENPHLARVDIRVQPDVRRRGVGSALLAEAERIAVGAGRSETGGMGETPVREGVRDSVKEFAARHGYRPAMGMVGRRLTLPLAAAHRESLVGNPKAHPDGYTMLTFADRWPEAYMADRCELGRRMSTDIPKGDQDLDEEMWDEDRVRHIEQHLAAQDRAKLTTAARDVRTGRLVAFTEIAIPLGAPEATWQHDTLVMREHRGNALGFAVKLANVLALQDAFPRARAINTWNAVDNLHMIAINEAMGFNVVSSSVYWLKLLDTGTG